MTRALNVLRAGPGLTIQDQGRSGLLEFGVSRAGAADPLALAEGAALLEQSDQFAALEMAGVGGEFEAMEDLDIALTGAPMAAHIDGAQVAWHASHHLAAGMRLTIGAAKAGTYGYLHVGGGFATDRHLGSRSAHLGASLGGRISHGDQLPVGAGAPVVVGQFLTVEDRFSGGRIRVVPSLQTEMFSAEDLVRFQKTVFERSTRGDRMGVRLEPEGPGFESDAGLSVLSEIIVPGDIQVTGDGTPFVLLAECQTTGGYPRIGSVLPTDLPRVAQAPAGAKLHFEFITVDEAVAAELAEYKRRKLLASNRQPMIRDPHMIADLLSYQLISGVTAGDEI